MRAAEHYARGAGGVNGEWGALAPDGRSGRASGQAEFAGQFAGRLNAHPLLAALLAAFQADLALGDTEGCGQKSQQVGIGLAVHWRGGKADLQAFAVQPGERIVARLGLQVAVEDQRIAVPAKLIDF